MKSESNWGDDWLQGCGISFSARHSRVPIDFLMVTSSLLRNVAGGSTLVGFLILIITSSRAPRPHMNWVTCINSFMPPPWPLIASYHHCFAFYETLLVFFSLLFYHIFSIFVYVCPHSAIFGYLCRDFIAIFGGFDIKSSITWTI